MHDDARIDHLDSPVSMILLKIPGLLTSLPQPWSEEVQHVHQSHDKE